MIRLSDNTIIECLGNYQRVKDTIGMQQWMLRSDATIVTSDISSNFTLHFWYNGDVVIKGTDHPRLINVPDSDLRELRSWCETGGWRLLIDDMEMHDHGSFLFWLQKYREGIVHSTYLENYDKSEMDRMTSVLERERQEEQESLGEDNAH